MKHEYKTYNVLFKTKKSYKAKHKTLQRVLTLNIRLVTSHNTKVDIFWMTKNWTVSYPSFCNNLDTVTCYISFWVGMGGGLNFISL